MRTILFILQKEFLQIFRNKSMLPIIFVIPIVQLIVLVNAATMEMKNIDIVIVDNDHSSASQKITSKFKASPFFNIQGYFNSVKEGEKLIDDGKATVILNIPANFEKQLVKENKVTIQILVNAINGVVAGISNYYIQRIVAETNKDIIIDFVGYQKGIGILKNINIEYSYWYNPELNYKTFMVPAVLVMLITIIGMFLSGMNIVREKEMGTIEQINVTPIKKYQFIAGKLIPFWIIAMFELAFGLSIGKLLFNIPIVGSIPLLFFVASFYLLVVLGLGLLLSTVANTQQQAMFVSFFFMIVFVMMSGVFTTTDSMPAWAKIINYVNPIYYFMKIVRMILLKGSGLMDIAKEFIILVSYAFAILSLAVWRYKKTS